MYHSQHFLRQNRRHPSAKLNFLKREKSAISVSVSESLGLPLLPMWQKSRDFIGMTLHWIGQLSSCLHLWALEWVNNWLHYIANFCGHLKALISNPKYSWNAQEDNEISGTQASKKCTLTIQPFKNHYQESAVNTNCPVGMYALMHPWEWINDERRSSNKSLGSAHIWYFFWCAVQGTHHWTIFRKIR